MTVQTKTFTVTVDGSDNPEPLTLAGVAVGFSTTCWVVINNLTPYVMELEGVGDNNVNEAALAPGTANKYQWTNKVGPLIANWVNPISGAPPSTPQVIVEYSDLPDGADLIGSYPAALQGGVSIASLTGPVTITGPVAISSVGALVTVGGELDFLGSFNGTALSILGLVTALNSYTALVLTIVATGSEKPVTVSAQDVSIGGGSPIFSGPVGLPDSFFGPAQEYQAIVGMACKATDELAVNVGMSASGFAQVSVYGSTSLQPRMRSDGRAYPLGTFMESQLQSGVGSSALVPASTSYRTLLNALTLSANGVGGEVQVTINGTTGAVMVSEGVGVVPVPIPEGGLLLDTNTPVSLVGATGVNVFGWANYDLVA